MAEATNVRTFPLAAGWTTPQNRSYTACKWLDTDLSPIKTARFRQALLQAGRSGQERVAAALDKCPAVTHASPLVPTTPTLAYGNPVVNPLQLSFLLRLCKNAHNV